MAWNARGDVVVMLPGITGSVLQRDGRDVFGLSVGAGLRALFSKGASIGDLALTTDPVDRPTLDDGVTAARLAGDAHLVPGLWKIDGYGKVGTYLRSKLRLEDGVDYHEFPYDWRRDNRVAARHLCTVTRRWLQERRTTFPDARLVLIAHSMGGLVARYFLEVLDGWRDTRALVTFGTPFRGSLNALDYLVNGYRPVPGLVDLSALMRSFTSVYQLLPIYPCISVNGGPLRRPRELEIELPGLDVARVVAADAFHREIEAAVARNQDDEEYRTRGYALHPVVGTEHPTSQSAHWHAGRLTLHRNYRDDLGPDPSAGGDTGRDMGGDGTVPRVSATPIEHSDTGGEWFAGTRHASLQNADIVLLQVRQTLQTPDLRLGRFRAMASVTVALDLHDAYPGGEPPVIRVCPSAAATDLVVDIERLDGPGAVSVAAPLTTGWTEVVLPVLPAGCHRVTVTGEKVEPASDLFLVT